MAWEDCVICDREVKANPMHLQKRHGIGYEEYVEEYLKEEERDEKKDKRRRRRNYF